jgi:hypothetical protein
VSVPHVGVSFPAVSMTQTPSAAPDTQSYSPEVTKNPQLVLVANALEVDPTLIIGTIHL